MRVISVVALLLTLVVAQVMCAAIDRELEDLLQILEKVKVKRTFILEDYETVKPPVHTFKAADKVTQPTTLKALLAAAGEDANKAPALTDWRHDRLANADEATMTAKAEKILTAMDPAIDQELEDLLQILEKVKVKRTQDEEIVKAVETFKAADKATQLKTLKESLVAAGEDANKAPALLDTLANADEATMTATAEKILTAMNPDIRGDDLDELAKELNVLKKLYASVKGKKVDEKRCWYQAWFGCRGV